MCTYQESDFVISEVKCVNFSGISTLVYKAGLEMMCNVALERRMGFLNNNMNTECGKIMTALKGYQTASSQAMYGLPWWKYLPGRFSGVFTRLVEHKDTLFNTIGQLVDESLSENESIVDESILGQLLNNHRLPIKEVKVSCVDYITGMYSLWKLNNFILNFSCLCEI